MAIGIFDSMGAIARWLDQASRDSRGVALDDFMTRAPYKRQFWQARLLGAQERLNAEELIAEHWRDTNSLPNPLQPIARFSKFRFVEFACKDMGILLGHASARYEDAYRSETGDREPPLVWLRTFGGSHPPVLMFNPLVPVWRWVMDAGALLGIYAMQRAFYTSTPPEVAMYVTMKRAHINLAIEPLVHSFAKGLLTPGAYLCPPNATCKCNALAERFDSPIPGHPVASGDLDPSDSPTVAIQRPVATPRHYGVPLSERPYGGKGW